MGRDLQSKNLLNCPDVFADVGNVNLFDGENIIHPDELEKLPTETIYRDRGGKLRHHYLDTCMKVKNGGTDIAIVCVENQNGVSNVMPVRDMGYLYSGYSEQIRKIRRENEKEGTYYIAEEIDEKQKLLPVISIVLYYGQKKWTAPEKLSDMLAMRKREKEKWKDLISDHKIRVIHLANQDERTRAKYKSDFRHIADYLAYSGDKEKCRQYIQDTSRVICHPEEYLDMMAAFTNDKRFVEIKESVVKKQKTDEEVTMFSIAEELEKQGMKRGIKRGIERGMKKGALQKSREIIQTMLGDGQSPELISKYTKEPVEYIYEIQREYKN